MFDSNVYRKDVLKPLLEEGQRSFDDAFRVFGLDPTTDDEAVIRTRIDEVVAFWRKEQSSPRYKGLATLLLGERDRLSSQLLDARRRADHRERIVASRASLTQLKFAHLDEMLATLERRMGGIPASRIDRLRETARRAGVTEAEFSARLEDRRVLDDTATGVAPPPPAVRQQARSLLAEHSRLQDGPQPVVHRTLFDFLGVASSSSLDTIREASEAASVRNRQRRHDRLRTVVDELLALVTDLLIVGDRSSYHAGLVEDVGDQLRPHVETAVLLEDRLTPVEFERLLSFAISSGLEADAARSLVVRVAKDVGAAIETGAPVDYVVCATCAAACGSDVAHGLCPSCGAELFRSCPGCGRRSVRSAARCPGCQLDLRALGEAEGELSAVRSGLDDGHVMDARWRIEALEKWAGALPEVADLRRRIDAALAEASELWQRLLELIGQSRFDDAKHVAAQLRERATDVPGPSNEELGVVLAGVEAALEDLERRVEAALGLSGDERESSILALAEEVPTAATVLAALRELPVAAPSRVMGVLGDGAIKVGWRASPSRGKVSYRVSRTVQADGGTTGSHPVGSTTDTSIEDAGVPPGRLVSYDVQAVRHGIASGTASTSTLLAAFDVDRLAAIEHDAAIELRWSKLAGEATIWVERRDVTDPSTSTRRVRAGESGVMDTDVEPNHRYSYRVFVEYSSRGKVFTTSGREIAATAVVVPSPPTAARVTTSAGTIRIEPEDAGAEVIALRCDDLPSIRHGERVDRRRLAVLGRSLNQTEGAFTDTADGTVRWYVLASIFGSEAVVGDVVLHPGFGDVSGLTASGEDDALVLRWQWPAGCTEAMVVWRSDVPPASVSDPAGTTTKVTNMAYDLAGGWRLTDPPQGQLHFLVRPARRIDRRIVTVPGSPSSARVAHKTAVLGELSYRVRRSGRRKRNLEVEIVGGVSGRPDLIVVARQGSAAPASANDGVVLGTLAAGERSLAVPLDDLDLPMVIALFPAPRQAVRIRMDHPALEQRTIT